MRDEIELTRRAIRWSRDAPPQDVGGARLLHHETRRRASAATRERPAAAAKTRTPRSMAVTSGRPPAPSRYCARFSSVTPRARGGGARERSSADDGERGQARGQHVEKIVEARGGPAELLEQAVAIADH